MIFTFSISSISGKSEQLEKTGLGCIEKSQYFIKNSAPKSFGNVPEKHP